ncbi:LmbE family protein [Caballeronia arationis]|uniref:PIG-L family deacetylase n=1 Tax=Caballeronia arationis TaxID=1777142 RepID=UPI00074D05EC|nr:PIG-L family deacetylase [Caballeronia arationis]SAK96023.1 LmbE family protein [Caballeronia arationis]
MPEASSILVISPHFDDAVFSCGAWIASNSNAVVCTVFAGCPDTRVATDWDHQCGFSDARQAMRERIAEDDRALELLGATGERLNFLDAQYGPTVMRRPLIRSNAYSARSFVRANPRPS